MATRKLICVGQAFAYTEADCEHDAFVYFDPQSLEFFVVEGEEEPGLMRYESELIPAQDYILDNPEWREDIRRTIIDRFEPAA
jgi:hypothetical protein